MRPARFQQTISHPCQVSGRGYWSGQPITLTFCPAPPNTGVQFIRTDLFGQPSVPAVVEHRVDMSLRTRLAKGRAVVDMVEHVLAALYALKIDNVEIHCTNCEMPGLDGSSLAYVLALSNAGRKLQAAAKLSRQVTEVIRFSNDRQWIMALPAADGRLSIEYRLDYGKDCSIGQSTYAADVTETEFPDELAPARTFITLREAQQLQAKGLARHVTPRDLLVFDDTGPIDNTLRFSNECARHKALDLLGDLALAGVDVVGRIIAYRSGHQLNGNLAQALRQPAADTTAKRKFA